MNSRGDATVMAFMVIQFCGDSPMSTQLFRAIERGEVWE
jgi:hypothetical protein